MSGRGLMLQLARPESVAQEVARDALLFVLRQWQSNFAEAMHVLPFPEDQGFRGPEWIHSGDVFQRAVIADALCDAAAVAGDQLRDVLAQEIDYLMSQRRTSGAGGWSYFPRLVELPPDADDLAQIITVLVRNGRYDLVVDTCEEPLRVLLEHGAREDGSFETWIVPSPPQREEEQLQHEWIAKAWGRGPDVDVVANLLHALMLYDREGFASVISNGARFLADRQNPDGSWSASWYWGPFYPTFVALRVLDSQQPVSAAVEFLHRSQHNDGGWGVSDASDPLSTALAVCALRAANTPHNEAHDRAIEYLTSARENDGGWPAVDWIRMDLGRAEGRVHTTLTYGSRLITTAYVLKATTT